MSHKHTNPSSKHLDDIVQVGQEHIEDAFNHTPYQIDKIFHEVSQNLEQ